MNMINYVVWNSKHMILYLMKVQDEKALLFLQIHTLLCNTWVFKLLKQKQAHVSKPSF